MDTFELFFQMGSAFALGLLLCGFVPALIILKKWGR